jgi:ribosomal protein S18 acetylase RimI-like enzyme
VRRHEVLTDHGRVNSDHPLDNPVRASLLGPQTGFLVRHGAVLRYPPDVAPFVALAHNADDSAWADIAAVYGPGGVAVFAGVPTPPAPGWEIVFDIPGVQLVDEDVAAEEDPEAVRLGPADVPEMLDLVHRTRPGPFYPRTVELGTYLGIRRDGALVAMAGERMRPPGHTEISAVCTDEAHRGTGLAARLVRAVVANIRARGDVAFLHASADNTNAIRLYDAMGFRLRRTLTFYGARVPPRPRRPVSLIEGLYA